MNKVIILSALVLAGCVTPQPIKPINGGVTVSTPSVPSVSVAPATASPIVTFGEDSAELTSDAQSSLSATASVLSHSGQNIRIIGHADETGSREYNLGLGAQRAASVRDYLVSNGISNARISITTVGNEQPAQNCGSLSCQAQNRRVVIIAN